MKVRACTFIVLTTLLLCRTQNTGTEMTPPKSLLFLKNAKWKAKIASECFRQISGITIDSCMKECAARRQRCKAINYRRQTKVCDLCASTSDTQFVTDVGSVTVLFDDYLLQTVRSLININDLLLC